MEPRLNKVFQRFNKDAEYHTFINETEAERDSSNAAEQEAVAAAERAKRDARNARIEKSKAAVEEWNKNTSMTRNKVEAKAQTRVDKMMKVAQKAAADCWDHAQSLDDVFDIWRKYLSELNNIPANEPLEQDGVPVNPTGMYYSYVITAGTKDYSKPMGIPCTSGYTTGFYKDEIRWAESEFNDWFFKKGSKPGTIDMNKYRFLFPGIVMKSKNINIFSTQVFPLVNRSFLVSTNNGKNISGTISSYFNEFVLAVDYFKGNSRSYTLK